MANNISPLLAPPPPPPCRHFSPQPPPRSRSSTPNPQTALHPAVDARGAPHLLSLAMSRRRSGGSLPPNASGGSWYAKMPWSASLLTICSRREGMHYGIRRWRAWRKRDSHLSTLRDHRM